MAQIRVRLKHQITIPARIAEAAQIKPDDMLEVAFANGMVTLTHAGRKNQQKSVMSYAGMARGAWGKTSREVKAGLAADRDSWER